MISKLHVWLIFITVANIFGLTFLTSYDVLNERVDLANSKIHSVHIPRSAEERVVRLYGFEFDQMHINKTIKELYVDYNLKVVPENNPEKADILLVKYNNIKKFIGKFNLVTFSDHHSNNVILFNKNIVHDLYFDKVFSRLYYFDVQKVTSTKSILSYMQGKRLEVSLVQDRILFDEADVITMSFFDKKSPIFYKEKEEISYTRLVFLALFMGIVLAIVFDALHNFRKSTKNNFDKIVNEILNNNVPAGAIFLFIVYLISPF